MKRITVEQVKAAYEKTGMTPARGTYGRYSGTNCGCAIGCLSKAAGIEPEDFEGQMNRSYCSGFIHGFDGKPFNDCVDDALGHADGRAVAAAIFGEAVPA